MLVESTAVKVCFATKILKAFYVRARPRAKTYWWKRLLRDFGNLIDSFLPVVFVGTVVELTLAILFAENILPLVSNRGLDCVYEEDIGYVSDI